MFGKNLQKSLVGMATDRPLIYFQFETVLADLDHTYFFCVGSHMNSDQHAPTTMISVLVIPL